MQRKLPVGTLHGNGHAKDRQGGTRGDGRAAIADAILAIREIAVHEGIMLPAHRKVSQLVLECGHAVPINDSVKEKRERLGMDALPETVHKYPEALSEVQTLLGRCGFDKLVAGSQE